jgi:hypothetical protein
MIQIYCLFDPTTGHPFYVGATSYRLNIRLANHINERNVYSRRAWSRKMLFIDGLMCAGNRPKIRLLYLANIDTVDHYEEFFHRLFVGQGFTMLQKPHAFSYKSTLRNGRYVSKRKRLRKYTRIYFKDLLIIIW